MEMASASGMNGIGNIKPGYHARACVFYSSPRSYRLVSWSVGQFFSRLYWGLYGEVRICKEFYFYQRINPADILEIINENLIFALSSKSMPYDEINK